MRLYLGIYASVLTALTAISVLGGVLLVRGLGPDDAAEEAAAGHRYDFVRWEIENLPRKWIYKIHNLFDSGSQESDEATIQRYFQLGREIATLRANQAEGTTLPTLTRAENERARLEADVEDSLEGRMTAVLEDEDLALEPPLFSDLGLVFPPVDFELDSPPRVLAISPRDRIEVDREFALEPGLTRDDYIGIEERAESENEGESGVSALVVGTSGVATYPNLLSADDDYRGMIETAFHEWLHNYLVFFPLGRSYFEGAEARTLNESVASYGGRELARVYFERYRQFEETTPLDAPRGAVSTLDFTTEMRDLRREVETMLAEGKITEAEALMEQRRDEFEDAGYFVRKINQAYFAFHGFYADSPGSIDPIGEKLETLVLRSGSPGQFIEEVRGVTSRAELDEVLAQSGG